MVLEPGSTRTTSVREPENRFFEAVWNVWNGQDIVSGSIRRNLISLW